MPFNINPQQVAMMRQRAGEAMRGMRPGMGGAPGGMGMPGGPALPTPTPRPAPAMGPGQANTMPVMNLPRPMANGGEAKAGASRGDGCAQRGKTKGRVV